MKGEGGVSREPPGDSPSRRGTLAAGFHESAATDVDYPATDGCQQLLPPCRPWQSPMQSSAPSGDGEEEEAKPAHRRSRMRVKEARYEWAVLAALALLLLSHGGGQGGVRAQYTGYPGFWVMGPEYMTPFEGPEVLSKVQDKISPCRYDGTQCTKSKNILSDPGEMEHDTGRSVCTERTTIPPCRARLFGMDRDGSALARIDALRDKGVYPSDDGHTTTSFASGFNFVGELGIGNRAAVHSPILMSYFKLGDGIYDQVLGGGRGFKNLSFVQMGFSHSFAFDRQKIFYAWGNNDYGQLGIISQQFPDGHRYKSLRPEPSTFFRPAFYYLCSGGRDQHLECNGPNDVTSCLGTGAFCEAGTNQVAYRRNSFTASKNSGDPQHSAVVTEFLPEGCFSYERFMGDPWQQPDGACASGGKLYTWGYNMKGALGVVSTPPEMSTVPLEVSVGERWYSVSAGAHHTVACTVSGKLYAWGLNNYGQLGVSERDMERKCQGPDNTPVPTCCNGYCEKPMLVTGACELPDGSDCINGKVIVHVTAGSHHTLALDADGGLWGFGHNEHGQLCQGTRVTSFDGTARPNFVNSYTPLKTKLPADVHVVDVVAGFGHNLAVSTEGELFVWGRNDRGQLGRGHTDDDSCHLEVRTDLPYNLDITCTLTTPAGGGRPVKRPITCNVLPGNSTLIAAGMLHSGVITASAVSLRKETDRYQPNGESRVTTYETANLAGDCSGAFEESCKVQGDLYRVPSTLSVVWMFGDNRFGQLGLDTKRGLVPRPHEVRSFSMYDWFGVFAGSRQTVWTSRVNRCPANCNGHGICNMDTGQCTCEYPWTYESDCLTAWCPNNCSSRGTCNPLVDVGETGTRSPLSGRGPECTCRYPFWDVDCSRAQCPNNCWGPDHGLCNNTDGTCVCVGNATVTYQGFDCYLPDPLHQLDPLKFYIQQLLRISPFFINGTFQNLTEGQKSVLAKVARYAQVQGGSEPRPRPSRLITYLFAGLASISAAIAGRV